MCLNFSCSQKIKFSLFLLLVGVGIASVTDLQLNLLGTVLSLLAIVTTCVGQIVSSFVDSISFIHNCSSLMWRSGIADRNDHKTYELFVLAHCSIEWGFFFSLTYLSISANKHHTKEA